MHLHFREAMGSKDQVCGTILQNLLDIHAVYLNNVKLGGLEKYVFMEKTPQNAYSEMRYKIQKIARIQKIGWIYSAFFFMFR